jgi:hypothetical protein
MALAKRTSRSRSRSTVCQDEDAKGHNDVGKESSEYKEA